MTPIAGYDGSVTLTCPSSLPTGVTCNSPVIAAGKTQATLTINTTAPTSAQFTIPDVNRHQGGSSLWASLGGLGLVGMVLAGDWKKRNRRTLGILLTVLAVVMILALVGCGGGSSSGGGGGGGGGGTGGTPANTYPLTITGTGTAGTTPQTVPITLVVQ
jgi:hypothetical protein